MKQAIILCSGGIDSVVTTHYVKKKLNYRKIIVLFFDYGQKSILKESEYSKACAEEINVEFIEIKLDWLGKLSESLINKNGKFKKINKEDLKNTKEESKKFYVPARNSLFIISAFALADSFFIKKGIVSDIFVGFKCEGQESYPDTTEEFIDTMNSVAKFGCSREFKVKAPLIKKDKEDIILLGKELGVDFSKTFSCYIGIISPCGKCLACALRKEGFYWAGLEEPYIINASSYAAEKRE